jgi:peptide chain release factor 1
MKIQKSDCKIETMRGTGPGGQHRNKTDSAVRITHEPTGISAYADERSQANSKRKAWKELEQRIIQSIIDKKEADKKSKRDFKIHNTKTIRTYDFKSGIVKDHRTGKTATIKEVLEKGKIDLLR